MRKVVLTDETLRRVRRDSRFRAALEARHAPAAWREEGRCVSAPDPDVFFPAIPEDLEPARKVCRVCPVAGACLAEALSRAEIDGVWGGTTSAERRTMRAVWRRETAYMPAGV